MPKKRPKQLPEKHLSPSEWRIMQVCWKLQRPTIRDILEEISARPPVMSYTMVHMLLKRMLEKRYVTLEQERGINYYTAAVDREKTVRAAAEEFVEVILAGESANLAILSGVLADRRVNRPRSKKTH
jgi:predicted transcriptional regulator